MISKGEGEAECLEKVERLQMILKLLDEEKKETKKSSGPDGGTDVVIHKLQTKKAEKPESVKNVLGKGSTATPIKTKPENVEINKDEVDEVSGKGPGASTPVKEKPIRKLETEKPEQVEKLDSGGNAAGSSETPTKLQEVFY